MTEITNDYPEDILRQADELIHAADILKAHAKKIGCKQTDEEIFPFETDEVRDYYYFDGYSDNDEYLIQHERRSILTEMMQRRFPYADGDTRTIYDDEGRKTAHITCYQSDNYINRWSVMIYEHHCIYTFTAGVNEFNAFSSALDTYTKDAPSPATYISVLRALYPEVSVPDVTIV